MAVRCLLTNTPWPWPTPAGAASARGGVPHPWNGAISGVEGRSAAEVCTSEARKIGVPLVARQGRGPSAGLASLHQLESQRWLWQVFFGQALRTGKARRGLWWKTPRPLELTKRRQAWRGAGQTTCQQPVRPPTTCCRDLRLLRNCWPKWSVATASSGASNHGCRCVAQGRILFAPISDEPRSRFSEGACIPLSERFPFSDAAPSGPRRTQL
jgi:hypothetical protein